MIDDAPIKEEDLQVSVAAYLDTVLTPASVWWHTPNGARMPIKVAKSMKSQGMKAGAPDITILDRSTAHFIELKRPDWRDAQGKKRRARTSTDQDAMHERLRGAGFPVVVCRSLDEVRQALIDWEIPTREKQK